jgi:glycosyltransferase involved in cell wall biosynthesis
MKFTIGLPIIKTGYLKETLDGIDNQIFKDYELIIKNNAASKETKDQIRVICKDWIKRENVQYLESDEQLKMTQNFNSILDKANGEFFTIMSDDDIMEPEFLNEINILNIRYPNVDVLHCRVQRIDGNSSLLDFSEICPEWESRIDFIYQRMKSKRTLYLSDFVVNTKELKKIGGFPIESSGWGCDEITWCKLASNGIGFTPKALIKYRRFLGNFSMSKENLMNRFKDVDLMHSVIEDIIKKDTLNKEGIYPQQFLIRLLNNMIQKQKDYILIHYAKSTNTLGVCAFFFKNRNELSYKGLLKAVAFKTIYGKEFVNRV